MRNAFDLGLGDDTELFAGLGFEDRIIDIRDPSTPPCTRGYFGSMVIGPPPLCPGMRSKVSTASPMRVHPPEKSGILSLLLCGSAAMGQERPSTTPMNKADLRISHCSGAEL
jgi:hypothetical protein